MKTARSCLIQPIDRDYRTKGAERVVHLEVLDEPVCYAIRTSVIPYVVSNEPKIITKGSKPMEGTVEKDGKVYAIRKLTPLECWRLMGFSDEDFHKAESVNSNTQLYKQAGNSIVKDVLMAIFSQMIEQPRGR